MPGLGLGVTASRPKRRIGNSPATPHIGAVVTPASSVLVVGAALRDTLNWSRFLDPQNYTTSATGETISTVQVNYIGSTTSASDLFEDGDINAFTLTVADTGGASRTFTVQSRTVVYAAPVAGTLAAVSETQGNGMPMVNLVAGFTGQDLTYSSNQAWATVSGLTLKIADEMRTGTVTITATNSGGAATVDLSVALAAPAVAVTDAIANQSFQQNSGDVTIDLDGVFENATSYSVTGAGASVSGSILTLSDDILRADTNITVTGANGFNSADDVFALTVSEATTIPAAMAAPTVVANDDTQITIILAADPDNGGATITQRDMRYRVNAGNWATQDDITSPVVQSSFSERENVDVQTRARNSEGAGGWSPTGSVRMPLAVPTAAGGLANQSFTEDTRTQTYDTSGDFTGASLIYSVSSVTGVSINSSTGVVSVDTGAAAIQSGTAIVVNATNSSGSAQSGFMLTIAEKITAPAQMVAPSLVVQSASQITATLASPLFNGGSAVTSYDLRWQEAGGGWTTKIGIRSPYDLIDLNAETRHNVQTRAVNALGAAIWSEAANATTDSLAAPQIPSISSFLVRAQSDTDIPITLDVSDNATTPYSIYIVAIPAGGSAPSAAQVVAGTDALDATAPISGSFTVTRDGDTNLTTQDFVTGRYDFYATVIDGLDVPWGDVASDLGVRLTSAQTFANPTALGAKLYAWADLTDPFVLFGNAIDGSNVADSGDSVGFIADKSGNGRDLRWHLSSGGARWDATNSQTVFGRNAMFRFIDNPTGLTTTMEAYFAVKTTDSQFILISRAFATANFAFIANSGSDRGPTGGAGSPTYLVGNVALPSPTRGTLQSAVGTGSGLVVGAYNLDLSNISADGANMFISSSQAFGNAYRLQGNVTHIVFTEALTTTERDDLYAWMATRIPV